MRFYLMMGLLCSVFFTASVSADTLLLLVSQRNAEAVATSSADFLQRYPQHSVEARTEQQLLALSQSALHQLIQSADVIMGAGLFGAVVTELEMALVTTANTLPDQPRLLFNSDHRLVGLSRLQNKAVFTSQENITEIARQRPEDDVQQWVNEQLQQYPTQRTWIQARSYWQAGGHNNLLGLWTYLLALTAADMTVIEVENVPRLQWFYQQKLLAAMPPMDGQPTVLLIDHAASQRPGERQLMADICQQLASQKLGCLVALAAWGEASVEALRQINVESHPFVGIVMLQDFVMGGGEGREAATQQLTELKVPLINAIRVRDRKYWERRLSADGLAVDKVHYQVAMPEMQGASQPLVVANAGEEQDDPITGIRLQPLLPDAEGVASLVARLARWHHLQVTPNAQKHIAIVYYNHPPGRHNIGADNLDVPASLWHMLNQLKQAGYNTGTLPASQEALLDLLQSRGVNLPNDQQSLRDMAPNLVHLSTARYAQYFASLPPTVQHEMIDGPFGFLHEQLQAAVAANKPEFALASLQHSLEELRHLVEGVDHPGRERALTLLNQLETCYHQTIARDTQCDWDQAQTIIGAIQRTGIEGLRGWGAVPGNVMTWNGELLLPGIQFGNIFIGPQPPRGWEVNEELLHANLAFPPPHQYLAFYYFLRDEFKADAFVHLGRHSTYEFLPRRSVGLLDDDYSRIIAADIPGIYPYIVDGVGEGIQAKRRGLAVMVDHLTPPLQSTPLYDELLQLRQLIESFESHHDTRNQAFADTLVKQIRQKVDALALRDELAQSMSAELTVMGIGFDDVDDDMLVHEIGHYLTDLQEKFMPMGLHVFGLDWSHKAIDMMVSSMAPTTEAENSQWRQLLGVSPHAEMQALLAGLRGEYVAPGKGNDPIRSPESLPTGRNFYALDNSLIPSRVAWDLGKSMARDTRQNNPHQAGKREALVLWASDVVRDEGVMIAFGLEMLGFEPEWNSRGIVKGLHRQAVTEQHPRRDMVFTTSGLFRDLYGSQMHLLDQAVLLALDAASDTIRRDYPALTLALQSALAPLGELAQGGSESLQVNQIAAHWVNDARDLLAEGMLPEMVGSTASLRIFGDAPGSYGAGINRLVERSGAWQQRQELADVYLRRLGHGYSQQQFGVSAQDMFKHLLKDVENSYFGRSSNLYGLIDNNDAFDYLGGLSLAVETLSGQAPNNFVINHADPDHIVTQPLGLALRQELRGRFLNPEWLQGLMQHGYAGARTMGSEFLEYLWGWQVTNPTLVGDWAWEEVNAVYMQDRYQLGLDDFLQEGHNVHVKTNMLAIMLVAIHKGFWHADDITTKKLAEDFAALVAIHGLPGSGHTTPDHPMMGWLQQQLPPEQWQPVQKRLDDARQIAPEKPSNITRLSEIKVSDNKQSETDADSSKMNQTTTFDASASSSAVNKKGEPSAVFKLMTISLVSLVLLIIIAGFWRRWRSPIRHQ